MNRAEKDFVVRVVFRKDDKRNLVDSRKKRLYWDTAPILFTGMAGSSHASGRQ
jgi:hypothetical protein